MTTKTERRMSDRTATWWSLALYPFAFVGAFVVGEGLASLYGYDGGAETAPWWVMLGAGGPALLVLAVPALVAVHFGRRALRAGDEGAKVPMWIAVGLAVWFALQNALGFFLALFLG